MLQVRSAKDLRRLKNDFPQLGSKPTVLDLWVGLATSDNPCFVCDVSTTAAILIFDWHVQVVCPELGMGVRPDPEPDPIPRGIPEPDDAAEWLKRGASGSGSSGVAVCLAAFECSQPT